jgi:hypothetical protein
MRLRKLLLVLGLGLGVCAAGCGGDGGTQPPPPTAAELTAEGWSRFEAGEMDTAAARFDEALALDDAFADALVGRGWTRLRTARYAQALPAFDAVLGSGRETDTPEKRDALGGRVLAWDGAGSPDAVIPDGLALLEGDSDYVFRHDGAYSASDVRWLVARAALETGRYSQVVAQLDVLSPGHGLNPNAAGFPEQALALLESLMDAV